MHFAWTFDVDSNDVGSDEIEVVVCTIAVVRLKSLGSCDGEQKRWELGVGLFGCSTQSYRNARDADRSKPKVLARNSIRCSHRPDQLVWPFLVDGDSLRR